MRHGFVQASLLFAVLLLVRPIQAATIDVGKSLPPVAVEDRGEIYLQADNKDAYRPWHSDSTRGHIVVLQHLAARLSAKSTLKSFNDTMEQRAYPPERVLVAVVVNLNDALWGTTALVQSELKDNKKKYPHSNIVADRAGVARKTWDLKEQNAAMAILDADGTVLFFKEGKPTEQETKAIIGMIDQRLSSATPVTGATQ